MIIKGLGKKTVEISPSARIGTDGVLYLYGDIGDWWAGLDASTIVNEIMTAFTSDAITVRIQSQGGSVMEGLAMYNALKASGKKIVVYIDGIAASMGAAVAMAGHDVYIPTNALMMLHKPWVSASGNSNELRDYADQLDVVEQSYIQLHADKTGKTVEEIAALLSDGKNHFFRGQAAIDYGLADHLIDHAIQIAAVAKLDKLDIPAEYRASLFYQPAAPAAQAQQGNNPMLFKIKARNGGEAMAAAIMLALGAFSSVKAAVDVVGTEYQNAITGEVEASLDDLRAIAAKLNVKTETQSPDVAAAAQAAADAAVRAHKARSKTIREIGAMAKADAKTVDEWIDGNLSIQDIQAKALEMVSARDNQSGGPQFSHVRGIAGGAQALRGALASAMLNRIDPANKLDDGSREFRGESVMGMIKAYLSAHGENVSGKSKHEVVAMAMHTTSDFPLILQDVANKVLQPAYAAKPKTFTRIARKSNVSDFRMRYGVQLGAGSALEKVNQAGEFKRGTVSEGGYGYKIDTYGKIFDFSRQLIINDDLDAFGRFFVNAASAAARLESSVFWSVFKEGKLSDNSNVFGTGATRGNQVSGAAINETSVSAARKAMRQMKGLDGEPINIGPAILAVNTERETEAEKFLSTVLASKTDDVNIFAGRLQLLVESELDGVANNPFYFFAAPGDINAMVYSYLDGEEAPYIETQFGFNTDGVSLKVRHDFGAGFEDWRGVVKATGAA